MEVESRGQVLRCLLRCCPMTAMRLSLALAASAWSGADAAGQANIFMLL